MPYRYQHNKQLTNFSRTNRKKLTNVERLLWYKLRNRQLAGHKFRRQYPIEHYILDFYCPEKKLAIELDGSQHIANEQTDEQRTKILEKHGIAVLRFWNTEVLQNTEGLLLKILEYLDKKTSS